MKKFFLKNKGILNNSGFTLIEALVAILILIIAILGLVGMQGIFARQSADRIFMNSLIDAASSALSHCQNTNSAPPTSYSYENFVVNIQLLGNCNPTENTCNTVTVTASAQGKSFSLTTLVCNFR